MIGEGKVNLLNTLEPIVHIILLQKSGTHYNSIVKIKYHIQNLILKITMIKINKQVVKLFMAQCDCYKLTKLGIYLKKIFGYRENAKTKFKFLSNV